MWDLHLLHKQEIDSFKQVIVDNDNTFSFHFLKEVLFGY